MELVDDNNPTCAETTALRTEKGHVPRTLPPAPLQLIQTVLTADGQRIHMHFIAQENQVMVVQLSLAEAMKFNEGLGDVLRNAQERGIRSSVWH